MKHCNMERIMHASKLSGALLGLALLAGSACNKVPLPEDGHGDGGNNTPATPAPGLLTRIEMGGAQGLVMQISYNQLRLPLVILQYANKLLVAKDSVVYDSNGKLQKVLNYTPDFISAGKFELSSTTKFEWDAKGNISRKTSTDQETGALEEENKYAYDASGNLTTLTTTAGGGTNLKFVATYTWNQKNIKKEVLTDGAKVLSNLSVAAFDQHPTYITHSLLRYLLEGDEHVVFSDQNPLEIRKAQYVTYNGKQDSIITVQKNTYEYNSGNRPVKVASTSITTSPGSTQTTVKGNISYEYSK